MTHVKKHPVTLELWQKLLLYGMTALLWLSGAVWLLLPLGHVARPGWMMLHGAAAMGFLLAFGTLLIQHVPRGWRQDNQRPSGALLVAICGILILTGWGLYYVGSDMLRPWISRVHGIIGLVLPALIARHVWLSRREA